MFDPTLEELVQEIQMAEKDQEKHHHHINNIIRRYTSRFWREEGYLRSQPENLTYQLVVNLLPQLVWDNPAVHVNANRVAGGSDIAQSMKDAIESWMHTEQLADHTLNLIALDFMFFMGVALVYLEEDTRWEMGAVKPAVDRIDWRDFIYDPDAASIDKAKFLGHRFQVDITDLMDDPEVIPETLDKLEPMPGKTQTKPDKYAFSKPDGSSARKTVVVWSIWLREKNEIRTVTVDPRLDLYEPTSFYGHPRGPYVVYSAHPVPNFAAPVSPLVGIEDQTRDLNVHAQSLSRSARRRKKFLAVEANHEHAANTLKTAMEGDVVLIKGLQGIAQEMEIGGFTAQQLQMVAMLRERADRASGMPEVMRGGSSQFDTATEATIAANAAGNRTEFFKKAMRKGTTDILERVGWYMYNTEGIVIPINRKDPYSGEVFEGLFFGGPDPTDQGAQWDDFDIRIQPYSMERISSGSLQKNMTAFIQQFLAIAAQIPMMPWIKWMNVINRLAEVYNLTNGEEFIWPEMIGSPGIPPQTPASSVLGKVNMPKQDGFPGRRAPGIRIKQPAMNTMASNGLNPTGFDPQSMLTQFGRPSSQPAAQ